MADFAKCPLQNQFETQLVGEISSGATVPFDITVKTAISFTPQTNGFRIILEPGTSKEEGMIVTAVSSTTWTIGTRGVPIAKGGADTSTTHGGGVKIIITDTWSTFDDMTTVMNCKADATTAETISGAWDFTGSNTATSTTKMVWRGQNVTTVQRDALTGVTDGGWIYNTTDGKCQDRVAGSWVNRESGGTFSNASTTVAGKVEVSTEAEAKAGTTTGGTGASLIVAPDVLADVIQDNTMLFAADAEANDTYVIAMTPAIDAYVTGQRFTFTANTANTGAATLNVNAKGAKPIVKRNDVALATGDIEANQVVEVVYDGTSMQMVSQSGMNTLYDDSDAGDLHYHAIKIGNGSTAVSANGATNIAHGLGRIPKMVTFTWHNNTAISDLGDSNHGVVQWDGTTGTGIYTYGSGAGQGNQIVASTATGQIRIDGTAQYIFTITMDATNIIMTVSSYTNTETIGYAWRVE